MQLSCRAVFLNRLYRRTESERRPRFQIQNWMVLSPIEGLAEELPCRHRASVALCGSNQNLLVVTPVFSDGSKRAFNRKQRATSSEFCNQNYLVFVRGAVRQLGSGDSVLSKKLRPAGASATIGMAKKNGITTGRKQKRGGKRSVSLPAIGTGPRLR